jgi:5,10-methylenetetrahydromethanopterin reductase
MSVPFRIGVLQLSMEPLDETVAMAKACEVAGFDTFWLAEAYPWWRAVIARETKKIGVGWGIVSPYTRHPVQIAMEARVLQEAAGEGRFLLGLGASKIFMKHVGEGEKGKEASPATVMRESLDIVKAMLSGEEVNFEGIAFSAHAPALKPDTHVPREKVPVYVGATGPVLQRLAGSHSDGLLTASITTPAFVRYARERMAEGAKKAGRDPAELDLGSVIVGSIGKDKAKGREGAREMAAMYLANKVQNIRGSADVLLQSASLSFEEIKPIADGMEAGGRKAAAQAVTDEVLEKVCPIAGTPEGGVSRGGLHPHPAGNLGREPAGAGQAFRRGGSASLPSVEGSCRVLVALADLVPDHAVLRAPGVGHLVADVPELGEELNPQTFLQDLHRAAFQRLGPQPDAAVNQLHVMVAEFLEKLVELRHRLRHYVRIRVPPADASSARCESRATPGRSPARAPRESPGTPWATWFPAEPAAQSGVVGRCAPAGRA